MEHEYVRHGALALLAGLDVHTGKAYACTPKTTGIVPFTDLAGEVMDRPSRTRPACSSSWTTGRTTGKSRDRLRKAHPNAIMIHTPVHASWLSQIEIFFSVIQKKAVSPNDFASLDDLSRTLLAFVDRYNQTAEPFSWRYRGRPQEPAPPHHRTRRTRRQAANRPREGRLTPNELTESPLSLSKLG